MCNCNRHPTLTLATGLTILLAAAGTLVTTPAVRAQTTWYVDDDAPGDPGPGDPTVSDPNEDGSPEHPFDAIQEGINAAVYADTVLVLDGTYTGDGNRGLDFGGRLITVRSENGPENCIIDCQGWARGFYFHNWETSAAVVEGFTVSNGQTTGDGGGMLCSGSSPMIVECVLTFNFARAGGGVTCRAGSDPLIVGCIIKANQTERWGGGVFCDDGSNPLIFKSQISDNVAAGDGGGGISCYRGSSPIIVNTAFLRNSAASGGGIRRNIGSSPTVVNCTVAANTAVDPNSWGGGIFIMGQGFSAPTLVNCILWGNIAENGGQIALGQRGPAVLTVSYCDVEGGEAAAHVGDGILNWGPGNIDADPLFLDPANDDYHVSGGSPVIDGADSTAVPADTGDLDNDGDTHERTPFDLDGNPRFVDDPLTDDTGVPDPPDYPEVVDMGAYEFRLCPGDVDGDGDVDLVDLAAFLGAYGTCAGDPNYNAAADFDNSGCVDLSDLATLLANYGAGT